MKTNFAFDKLRSATKTVFDRVAKASNTETDPDLMIYNSLKSEDFDNIMQTYGVENTMSYIKSMEYRRAVKRR